MGFELDDSTLDHGERCRKRSATTNGLFSEWHGFTFTTTGVGNCYRGKVDATDGSVSQGAGTSETCFYGPPPPSGPPSQCHTCGGSTEPLALDLNGDGFITTTGLSMPVYFDLDADGEKEWITWLSPADGDGFLWLDVDPNHRVDSGFELFGVGMMLPSGQRASSGFEALAAYDTPEMGGNGDAQITPGDRIWGRLRVWVDSNVDGVAQPAEISTLTQHGIRKISLQYVTGDQIDGNGNNHYFRSVFTQFVRHEERVLPIDGLIFQKAAVP